MGEMSNHSGDERILGGRDITAASCLFGVHHSMFFISCWNLPCFSWKLKIHVFVWRVCVYIFQNLPFLFVWLRNRKHSQSKPLYIGFYCLFRGLHSWRLLHAWLHTLGSLLFLCNKPLLKCLWKYSSILSWLTLLFTSKGTLQFCFLPDPASPFRWRLNKCHSTLLQRRMSNHMWEISFERLLIGLTVSMDTFNGHHTSEWSTEVDGQGTNQGINALQAVVLSGCKVPH